MDKGRTKQNAWTWEAIGAIFGLTAGISAALFGGLLTASTWFLGAELHPWLRWLGTALMVSTIPLIIFAGYCLDWMEREPKKAAAEKPRDGEGDGAGLPHLVAVVFSLSLLYSAAPAELRAQQTIFNVPTTDVLKRGQVYAELDVPFKPHDGDAVPRFSSFVPRVVVGAGGRTEVGLNVAGNVQPGADVTTIVPTVKHKLYDGGDNGFALVVGDNLFIPVRKRDLAAYEVGNYFYLNGSKTVGKTRLTAGAYHFSRGVVAAGAQRAGGQFGFEQTVKPRFTVAADWITGRHSAGYFTPGVYFKPDKQGKITGYAGYSVGNTNVRGGNHFFLLEIGYNFN